MEFGTLLFSNESFDWKFEKFRSEMNPSNAYQIIENNYQLKLSLEKVLKTVIARHRFSQFLTSINAN